MSSKEGIRNIYDFINNEIIINVFIRYLFIYLHSELR